MDQLQHKQISQRLNQNNKTKVKCVVFASMGQKKKIVYLLLIIIIII